MNLIWVFMVAYTAAVYVGWPMNEQLPNVARVNETYLFTLADSTYKLSSGGAITYSVSGLPSWLLFEANSRAFSGTPSASDVGTFLVTLTGRDTADGSLYSAAYLMLVANNPGWTLSSADVMFTQIAQYGKTNGVDGLVVTPGQTFSIRLADSVFKPAAASGTKPITSYYGRSGDRTSLPNWVNFDADSLTFAGQVPSVVSDIAPSIEYTFAFIGTDYAGYAGAEGVFKLVVGAHQLSTSLNESVKINGTYGSRFTYTVPVLSDVFLDGAQIARQNISTVTPQNLPSYVLFDPSSYSLSGTFPNASSFQNFSVLVRDIYGDLVSLPYLFDSLDSVFTVSTLPDVNATRGDYFLYQLMRSSFTDINDTTVDVSFGNGSSWLAYHSSNMTINGVTPPELSLVEVTVEASSDFGKDLRSFRVLGVDGVRDHSSSSASSSASATSSNTSSSSITIATTTSSASPTSSSSDAAGLPVAGKKDTDAHKKLVLGLAIGLPLFALLLALLLLFICCCRKKKTDDNEKLVVADAPGGPGFGRIDSNDDHNETAIQLGAINALKLDDDKQSTISSLTHVDSNEDGYYDASEKPKVSWRANEASDSSAMKKMLLQERHASEVSMSTVNTEQLFSVRLVDDSASNRNSSQSFGLQTRRSSDLPGVLRDVSSGNIQRLDSDGNVVASNTIPSSPSKTKAATQTSLNNILEEDSNNTFYTQESSDYDLLAKFLGPDDGLHVQELQQNELDPHMGEKGTAKWRTSFNSSFLPSPDTDTFYVEGGSPRYKSGSHIGENPEAFLSRSSVYSDMSYGNPVDEDGPGGSKVKLVDFTRKASLRDSSRQQHIDHSADKAQIFDDSD